MSADSSTSKNGPINVKLLMLGHGSVGKSSLLLRFTDQQWLPELEATATIGVDTWSHKLDVKGRRVNLTVWDTPGVERFRALTSSYYRGTQGILLGKDPRLSPIPSERSTNLYAVVAVYDITDRQSYWSARLVIIIGNKADKEHARQVPTAEAAAYAGRMGCLFVEASAKTAIGVCAAFRSMVERIVETPELWAGQESHIVSPSKAPIAGAGSNHQADDAHVLMEAGAYPRVRGYVVALGLLSVLGVRQGEGARCGAAPT
ncbi:P-loop containing nucleoside triphosphate hydrolase protein [Lactarius deliciosus]|nr:P-loop containing nucleoside triphosphate hydrolase protein [Lactarius deliciosus]